jgi:glycosyltransferase involved in cell wall biosynthesis
MPWLPAAIGSVIDQRQDVDVELIVLDGGSTDGSREWLSQQVRTVATLVFEPDSGQTDALMRGLRMASGEYLGWLNSDDLIEPGALRSVADALDAAPDASAVSGCCLQLDEGGALIGLIPTPPSGSLDGLLRYPNNLAQPATFFRAEAYRRCGGLDAAWSLAMDVDLWMKLARVGCSPGSASTRPRSRWPAPPPRSARTCASAVATGCRSAAARGGSSSSAPTCVR